MPAMNARTPWMIALLACLAGCAGSQVRDRLLWQAAGRANAKEAPAVDGRQAFRFGNGDLLVGTFRNGQVIGPATVLYADGKRYDGEFFANRIHGQGTLQFPNGDRYDGAFVNGRRHGQGRYRFGSGGVYTGSFADDQISGSGSFVYANGDRYRGQLRNGSHHGLGRLAFANGRAPLEGRWEEGRFVWPERIAGD